MLNKHENWRKEEEVGREEEEEKEAGFFTVKVQE
jgi:hypothetical protein